MRPLLVVLMILATLVTGETAGLSPDLSDYALWVRLPGHWPPLSWYDNTSECPLILGLIVSHSC